MESKTNPNDPAYPVSQLEKGNLDGITTEVVYPGFTKREYFAGLAMQGLLEHFIYKYKLSTEALAENSLKAADALIAALNKPTSI